MVIIIKDYVEIPSSYKDGEKIYNLIYPKIYQNEVVSVSFEGIQSVTSSFINAAFIRLLEQFSFEVVKSHLKFQNSTRHINELIRHRFEFAANNAATH